jgi:hypothetical protein
MNTQRQTTAGRHTRRSAHVWIGLGGAAMIVLSIAVPWTEMAGRALAGWDLFHIDKQLLAKLEQTKQRQTIKAERQERVGERPRKRFGLIGKNGQVSEKLQQARTNVTETVAMVESILLYARYGLFALVAAAFLQLGVVIATENITAAVLAYLSGFLGAMFSATLLVLAVSLSGIELPGASLPLLAGYWLAAGGALLLAVAGVWRGAAANWKLWPAAELLPALLWAAFFSHMLGLW